MINPYPWQKTEEHRNGIIFPQKQELIAGHPAHDAGMHGITQGRAANVVSDCLRNIHAVPAAELQPESQVHVIKVGKKNSVEPARILERATAVERGRSTSHKYFCRLVQLTGVRVLMTQAVCSPSEQKRIPCSVKA